MNILKDRDLPNSFYIIDMTEVRELLQLIFIFEIVHNALLIVSFSQFIDINREL